MRTLAALVTTFLLGGSVATASEADEILFAQVRTRMRSLQHCGDISTAPSTKATVHMRVDPAGAVSDVSVDGMAPDALIACVATRVRGWKFSPFEGEPRRLSYPIVFVAAP
jgi:hypothetical protein